MKKVLCLLSVAMLSSLVAAPVVADDEKKETDEPKRRAVELRRAVDRVAPGFAGRIGGFGGVELTDEQKEKMKKIAKQYGEKIKEVRESFKTADSDEAKKELREKLQAAGKEFRDAQNGILTDEQKKKREEFMKKLRTRRGPVAWGSGFRGGLPGIELSDEQKEKMKKVSEDYMKKMKKVREEYQKADTDEAKKEVRTKMGAISKEFRDARMGVLTEEQKTKYEERMKKMRERFKRAVPRRIERKPAEPATPEI